MEKKTPDPQQKLRAALDRLSEPTGEGLDWPRIESRVFSELDGKDRKGLGWIAQLSDRLRFAVPIPAWAVFAVLAGVVGALGFSGWVAWNAMVVRQTPSVNPPPEAVPQAITEKENAGWISIGSEPSGAIVLLNGATKGNTPLQIRVPADTYLVAVSAKGYKQWERSIFVNADESRNLIALLESIEPSVQPRIPAADSMVAPDSNVHAKDTVTAIHDTVRVQQPAPAAEICLLDENPAVVSGAGRRTTGEIDIAVLELASAGPLQDTFWRSDDFLLMERFISRNTALTVRHERPRISCRGTYASFDRWLRQARKRGTVPENRPMIAAEPEQNALDLLADAVSVLAKKQEEECRDRVNRLLDAYFQVKFRADGLVTKEDWTDALEQKHHLSSWQRECLKQGQGSYRDFTSGKKIRDTELLGVYAMLRTFQIMDRPVLFCELSALPDQLSDENRRMLRTYIESGGFIYFADANNYAICSGIRDVIAGLTQEILDDSLGKELYRKMEQQDRGVSGYVFDKPQPSVFHPITFIPMILPNKTTVEIAVYNRYGRLSFADTLRDLPSGEYTRRSNGYSWNAIDNSNNELPSGYYVLHIEAGLCRATYPLRISDLRRLSPEKHPVFSCAFPLSDVPSPNRARPEDLPYGNSGVFGVTMNGHLAICYTEGYGELRILHDIREIDLRHEAILRWITNVVVQGVAEGSLARGRR
jgi:hypothetical protein